MFRRSLSDEFVARLYSAPFWPNVLANPALQPEIRNNAVTIYCRGSGLIRDLRLDGGRWVAWTHPTFVPMRADQGRVLELGCDDRTGLAFPFVPTPLPPGLLSEDVVAAYVARLPVRPEDVLKDAIIRRKENTILDQEVAFADSRSERDRVDLCAYLAEREAAALVEIKRIEDTRLVPKEPGGEPEVLGQLAAYSARLVRHGAELLRAYQEVVRLKRRLGLGGRLGTLPEDGPVRFLPRPILVIGGCSDTEVGDIKAGRGRWAPLTRGLPGVSAALVLCGDSCKLAVGRFRHTLAFE